MEIRGKMVLITTIVVDILFLDVVVRVEWGVMVDYMVPPAATVVMVVMLHCLPTAAMVAKVAMVGLMV